MEQKTRSDNDLSIFNSDNKRKVTCTSFDLFKKHRNNRSCETTSRILNAILKQQFNSLSLHEKELYDLITKADLNCAPYLLEELVAFLLKTKGKISYDTMANQLGNIVCPGHIQTSFS